jgi:uncharacterized membrane protein (UPF0127 family)
MSSLKSIDKNQVLLANLRVAHSLRDRLVGLIGTASLTSDQGLWIERCNSIHTFFMTMTIDCVFINSDDKIVFIAENIKPNRITWPRLKARSVLELPAGRSRELKLSIGEKLHVGA